MIHKGVCILKRSTQRKLLPPYEDLYQKEDILMDEGFKYAQNLREFIQNTTFLQEMKNVSSESL